ncbi:MAG: hypothetical protein JSR73_02125 [Proteobacteria bacterium]|nr:hypothetical protein [Pseudomonadota bacterium]
MDPRDLATRRRVRAFAVVRRLGLAALASLATGLALAAGPAPGAAARVPAATQADCDNLLRQFDVAWPAHRDAARAAGARRSRDQGAADCHDGRFADGVHNLRRALHDIGVKPVKSVSLVPSR